MKRGWAVAACAVSLLAIAVAFCLHEVGNSDLFWHLRTGELLARTGDILDHDVFSYTREGAPWTNLEWLTGLVFYGAYRLGDFVGMSLLSGFLGLVLALLVFYCARRLSGSWPASLLLTFLVFFAGAERIGVLRAEIFGYIHFAAVLLIFTSFHGRRAVWLAVVAVILWANTHPSAVLGPPLIAIYLLVAFLTGNIRGAEARGKFVTLAACFLGAFVNPFTYRVYSFPFRELGQTFMMSSVSDWSPPGLLGVEWGVGPWLMVGLATAVVITAFFVKKVPWGLVVVSAGLMVASFFVGRFVPFAMIALAFLMAIMIGRSDSCRVSLNSMTSRVAITLFCISGSIIVMSYGPILGLRSSPDLGVEMGRTLGVGLDASEFPEEAVDFMRGKIFGGVPFNDMAWGGYLIWRLWPKERVFIDTRTSVYGDEFIKRYSDALFDEKAFDKLHDEYGFNYVIYDARQMMVRRGPLSFLAGRPDWMEFVRTDNAVVYLSVKRNE